MRKYVGMFSLVAGLLVGGILISTIGGALPYPYSAIGPTLSNPLRMQMVREAAAKHRSNCLLVVGNSRVAFGVDTEALSTPKCVASNLGFPGLGPQELLQLIREQAETGVIKEIVFFVSDDFLIASMMSLPPKTEFEWSDLSILRKAVISHYRVNAVIDSLQGKPLPGDLWYWNAQLGRWHWPGLSEMPFSVRQGAAATSAAIAANYYANKSIASTQEVATFMDALREITLSLTIVFPPQHSWFARDIDRVSPGAQRKAIDVLAQASASKRIRFIDCSRSGSCGVSDDLFADPVHLNAEGPGKFTAFLKAALAKHP